MEKCKIAIKQDKTISDNDLIYSDVCKFHRWKTKQIHVGELVNINLCNTTQKYTGMFLGQFLCGMDNMLMPAFYIQILNKIVWGFQCWWIPINELDTNDANTYRPILNIK